MKITLTLTAALMLSSSAVHAQEYIFRKPMARSASTAVPVDPGNNNDGGEIEDEPITGELSITGEEIPGYAMDGFTVQGGSGDYTFSLTGTPPDDRSNAGLIMVRNDESCGSAYCYRGGNGGLGSHLDFAMLLMREQAQVTPGIYNWGVHVTDSEGRSGDWETSTSFPSMTNVNIPATSPVAYDVGIPGFGAAPYTFSVDIEASSILGSDMPAWLMPSEAGVKGLPKGVLLNGSTGAVSGVSQYELQSSSHTTIIVTDSAGLVVRKVTINWR